MSPCLKTAMWTSDSNTCSHLANGTNNIWYKVGRGYFSSLKWCESFLNCYGSNYLRSRCRHDFGIYYSHRPTFTIEILSYLLHTRIQVNYQCMRSYPEVFAVNVIRCNSQANGNGKFISWSSYCMHSNSYLK